MKRQNVDLNTLAGGMLQEKFNMAFYNVLNNLLDPNTPFAPKRSITIKIDFTQNEERDDAKVDIGVSTKLAPISSAKTSLSIAKDLSTGDVAFKEYGKQLPGQMSFNDVTPQEPEVISSQPKNLRVIKEA